MAVELDNKYLVPSAWDQSMLGEGKYVNICNLQRIKGGSETLSKATYSPMTSVLSPVSATFCPRDLSLSLTSLTLSLFFCEMVIIIPPSDVVKLKRIK